MPRYRVTGSPAFINGTLYHKGGVATLESDDEANKYGVARLRRVSDDVPESFRPPVGLQPVAIKRQEAEEVPPSREARLASESGLNEETVTAILGALGRLNREDDAHWTKEKRPDLNVLSEYAGIKVTRKMLDAVAAEVTRDEGEGEV